MATDDDSADDESGSGVEGEESSRTGRTREEIRKTKERLGEEADKAVEGFDEGVVDLLSWVLDTETRARIYVYLREHPNSTSEEVADGTGLYPSTVREALAELHDEEKVDRRKRESAGAGNNPYEYQAIAPSELVQGVVGQVQEELNTVFNLDRRLGGEAPAGDSEPVTISVDGTDTSADTDDDEAEYGDSGDGDSGDGDSGDGDVGDRDVGDRDAEDRDTEADGDEDDDPVV